MPSYATIYDIGTLKAAKVATTRQVELTITARDGSNTSTTCIVTIIPA